MNRLLLRLRRGEILRSDWQTLCERNLGRLPAHERALFENGTVQLFATKADAEEYNLECLQKLGKPILVCNASHGGPVGEAKGLSSDHFMGLRSSLSLSVGALVMLRSNLWVNQKLVNGTIGTVVDILFSATSKGPPDLPSGVVIHVPGYSGPGFSDQPGHILITPMTARYLHEGKKMMTRTQLPLCLCWGITIHKSQGMTVGGGHPIPRIKVSLGKFERSLGLTFVALSRVTSLTCLAFDPMPPFERMQAIAKSGMLKSRLEELDRIDRLAQLTDTAFAHLDDMDLARP